MNSTAGQRPKQEIDLNKVPPLDHHRTAVSFNCMILKMTEILNSFGNQMEDVLEKAEQTLDVADRKLRLMEAKLSTVCLEKTESPENIQSTPSVSSHIQATIEAEPHESPSTSNPTIVPEEKAESIKPIQSVLIKDDPAYNKYFKMLKMGVPEVGVIQKMESEGVDPSILKRGDEPSDVQLLKTSGYDSSGESVSSFSDSD